MPARSSFDYAIIRVVPEEERGERINVGVVLICRQRRYLGMRLAPDDARLLALWPPLDVAAVRQQLDGLRRVCEGDRTAGPIARLSQAERFHWLVAPSSTIIQPSPTHSGLCANPAAMLDELLARLVALPTGE
ncbi:MAG TPA: DUF3037 domain-containing protein [Ktedonobacterales bacterium]|jgi:hypothetical protein